MKTLMSITSLAILFAIFAFSNHRTDPIPNDKEKAIFIKGKISHSILKTANGCGIGNFLIPNSGDANQGVSPTLNSISDNWPYDLHTLATIPGTEIKSVAFKREEWIENTSVVTSNAQTPFVVISDTGLFSFMIPSDFSPYINEVTMIDSLFIPGIEKVAKQVTLEQSNPIVLYVNDSTDHYSLRFYDYPSLQEQNSFPIQFVPEIFEVTEDGVFVSGQDTSGNYNLYQFNALQNTPIASYTLNENISNAQEFLQTEDALYILSSPGDSVTMLSSIILLDNTLIQEIVYSKSGARATNNEYKNEKFFTFQPISDFPDETLNKQILILNPQNSSLDTFIIDQELDYFKQAKQEDSGFGFFPLDWVGTKWEANAPDSVYLGQYSNVLKFPTEAFPQNINATYGCWVNVKEREDDKIKFSFYPNPASSEVTINLTGLIKGRVYKLDILDSVGKSHYSTQLQAYEKLQLPLENLAKGIYFLNLETGQRVISKKLIIQ